MSPTPISRRRLLLVSGPSLAMMTTGCMQSNNGEVDGSRYVEDWHEKPVRGGAPPLESSRSCTIELGSETTFLEEAVRKEIGANPASSLPRVTVEAIPKEYYGQAELGDHYSVSRVLHLRARGGLGVPILGDSGPDVIQKPTTAFQELVDATPRAVLSDPPDSSGASACKLPVYVKDTYIQHE